MEGTSQFTVTQKQLILSFIPPRVLSSIHSSSHKNTKEADKEAVGCVTCVTLHTNYTAQNANYHIILFIDSCFLLEFKV
jgi:hypothetical protein